MRLSVRLGVVFFFGAAAAGLAGTPAAAQPPQHLKEVVRMRAYQGRDRGPEQTDRFSAKYRIGRDGRVSIANISGDITVTAGGGDEVSVEAVKRTHGDRSQLDRVRIQADNAAGRVDIKTVYPTSNNNINVSVDFTVSVPSGVSLDVHSISGSVKVTGVRGSVRAETISGGVSATDTPKLELAKTVSGDVTLAGVQTDGDVSAGTISGTVSARGLKAHGLDISSISGDIVLADAQCDRLGAKSMSGSLEFSGGITRNGSYSLSTHSGSVRLALANPSGFALNAASFSGTIRSDFPVTLGSTSDSSARSDRRRFGSRSMHAVFGDGSATLTINTFSGDIVIAKK
ncbi:MAG TPA: DUF4097 family beta strand repeat-containing protein [Vicinamibacterales bacterium]|nr:DUF4097 family beta strand repeat-containing protein [Vicinamibacterales bacterium]